MTWNAAVGGLEIRKRLAEQMGGPERKQGKLTVCEQIVLLTDPGSFR